MIRRVAGKLGGSTDVNGSGQHQDQEEETSRGKGGGKGDGNSDGEQEDEEQKRREEEEAEARRKEEKARRKAERREEKERERERQEGESQAKQEPLSPCAKAFIACKFGKYRELEKILQDGLPIESRHEVKQFTMLQMASMHGDLRLVYLLLRSIADINAINLEGNTATHLAYMYKYRDVAEYLRSKGADTRIRNLKLQTCYDMEVDGDDKLIQGRA
jgi:hypothetical protein